MKKFHSQVKIHQEAYMRIKHIESGYYLGFDEEAL